MTSLLILFGSPGVGKNYVGKILRDHYAYHFYDADVDLTPAMKTAIQHQQIFTQTMRDEFIHIVIEKLTQLAKLHPKIAVAQALAKEINRHQILTAHPHTEFLWVNADASSVDARLKARQDWVSVEYAERIRQLFEIPQLSHYPLDNNQGALHVKAQLQLFLQRLTTF